MVTYSEVHEGVRAIPQPVYIGKVILFLLLNIRVAYSYKVWGEERCLRIQSFAKFKSTIFSSQI